MAALLFQHGATVDDIDRARTYAKKANALQSTCSTRRMMALTEDRWLMYQHKPQKYGTQFRAEPVDGGTPKWVLYEVDPTVTDAQRAAALAAAAGVEVRWIATGTNDEPGSDTTNARVRAARAQWLADALRARGIANVANATDDDATARAARQRRAFLRLAGADASP